MPINELLTPGNVRRAVDIPRVQDFRHLTYVVWDMSPVDGWLPESHPARSVLGSDRYRPLYVGKAAGWSSVIRHLAKDRVGCGLERVSDKNVINEGLIGYCLNKSEPGWLGMTYRPAETGLQAQTIEQELVLGLGWRRDVVGRKLISGAERKAAYAQRGVAWKSVEERIRAACADVVSEPTPLDEGILLNQTDPKPDSRGLL